MDDLSLEALQAALVSVQEKSVTVSMLGSVQGDKSIARLALTSFSCIFPQLTNPTI